MEVEIICTETIKPSSPTPHHLKTHKLSLLDQFAPSFYIPILLFYSPKPNETISRAEKSSVLKDSLSKTLTHFYPFAGRIKDFYSIDCNDDGATYIEAEIKCDVSNTVLKEQGNALLLQLLPCNPLESSDDRPEILAVQINYFACGGMAIGVCIRHLVADGSASASFVKTWAAISNNGISIDDTQLDGVVFDCTNLFPPQNISGLTESIEAGRGEVLKSEYVTKRFVFDASKVAALRNEIIGIHPTRVEAVSAVIWNALIKIAAAGGGGGGGGDHSTVHNVTESVNVRKRMNPPLPELCIGNVYHIAMATYSSAVMEEGITCNLLGSLAGKVHESIVKTDDKYVRKVYGSSGEFLNVANDMMSTRISFSFSSWCRFPFYETDFGWGKPIWFATVLMLKNVAIFVDTSDGEGVEAWIALSKEEMTKLENDPGILAYASINPTISIW